MDKIIPFDFRGKEIRIVVIDGEPWFVAKDVAELLGYVWKGVSGTMPHVPEEWRGYSSVQTPSGDQDMAVISEAGLYFFLGRSDKPATLPLQKWVAGEVLPTFRKTGGIYLTPGKAQELLLNPEMMIAACNQILQLQEENRQKTQMLNNEREQKELALSQRDEAIETKAWISTKKAATAMNTASILSKKNTILEDAAGIGKNFKSVKAIPWLRSYFYISNPMYQALGKKLTSLSREMGVEKKMIDDSHYGRVGGYHVSVIDKLRDRLDVDRNMLWKYRRYDRR